MPFNFSLAESARLMCVTHRPKPVMSPENRPPKGVGIYVGHRTRMTPALPQPASLLRPMAL